MNDDWSLLSVIRGFSITIKPTKNITNIAVGSSSAVRATSLNFSSSKKPKSETIEGLPNLFKPVYPKMLSMQNALPPQPPQSENQEQSPVNPKTTRTTTRTNKHLASEIKMNPMKRVCHVPINDEWTWRKYGCKSIKGSPYTRSYYRCSHSKDCPARKRTEKSKYNSDILIVTYSDEHNHPVANSLSSGANRPNLLGNHSA